MKRRHKLSAQDAIRLLRSAIAQVQYFDKNGEGLSPGGHDPGELILQDALEYLSWGDTHNARILMEEYDRWMKTGDAPWPYNGKPSPGNDT